MATEKTTTELVLDRVAKQQDRIYDLDALIRGALAMCDDEGDPMGRLIRQALDLANEIVNGLDVVLLTKEEVSHG